MQIGMNEHDRAHKGELYTLINTKPLDLTYVPGHICFVPFCVPELATF